MTQQQRLDMNALEPEGYQAVLGMEKFVRSSSLEPSLRELVKIRASQLNGCAFCLDMHSRDAVAGGETPRRIYVLSAWREAPDLFTERERAAMELTERVTLIGEDGVPEDVWQRVRAQFDEHETAQLIFAIAQINVWNRLAVATHQSLPEVGE
ncbi:carboxymuconolactone decarboxylase family protein [Microbacterium sp. STN6]|uniref:carboxymuconolactone decarboxylase family protein n=1 Tax=Microbacterium sp. STN6 TaxID=2995588 RepID=UPI002260FAB4|nr:carboxymuconolactone decarboxylase family protein [Microbacterium sp. STN6]MCX7523004.1 carboxymuconolactone decarboxylase family protein [Microbacterium sp. STN6]